MSTRATFADLLAMSPSPLPPGRQTIHVLNVTTPGGRFRLHVRSNRGEEGDLSLGEAGRTRTRRLRALLGDKAPGPCPDLEQVREALVGKHFEVRLTQEEYAGYSYLEIRRA